MLDRAETVARKVLPTTRPQMIAVVSGKGGVGKTNLAVNLAVALHRNGVPATLVDLDLGLANADVLLDVKPHRDLRDVLAGRRAAHEAITETTAGPGLLAGFSGYDGLERIDDHGRESLLRQFAGLPGKVAILDCAAGVGRGVMSFALAADVALVVTTPEPTARADAYAMVKMLIRGGFQGSIRLLVNRASGRHESLDVFRRLNQVCEKFLKYPIADAGYLLHDAHVELAVRQRVPFVLRYPRCPASLCVSAIAARLVNSRGRQPRDSGWLQKVVGMFT
jgi:flagellar biosynthesis protein FlhG